MEEISIAPAVVKKISDGPIDLAWVKALDELERRSRAIETKSKGHETILAVSDVKPLLHDLTNKVKNGNFHPYGFINTDLAIGFGANTGFFCFTG